MDDEAEELVLLDGGNFSHSVCVLMSLISAKLFFDTKEEIVSTPFINVSENTIREFRESK